MGLRCACLATLFLAAFFAEPAFAGGKLERIEETVRKGKEEQKGKEKKSSSRRDAKTGEKTEGDDFWGEVFLFLLRVTLFPLFPFEHQMFPYRYGEGYMVYPYRDSPFDTAYARKSKPLAWEVRGSYQLDLDGVHALRFLAKMRCTCWISFDLDVTHYFEPRDGGGWDELTFSKLDADFNVLTTPNLDLDLGLGVAYVEGLGIYGGANAKITGDVFPVKPWGIHFAAGASAFGTATIYETEFAVGLFFNHLEIRAGYRSTWVEDVSIHGPYVGISLWF
jgi:hypothetical protein